MPNVNKRILNARESAGLSLSELSNLCGVTRSALQRYETGATKKIPLDAITAIENALNLKQGSLMGWTEEIEPNTTIPKGYEPPPEMVPKPLVGKVSCGVPILAEQNITDYINVPGDVHCDFLLTCTGDSMIDAGIQSGDIVYLVKQPDIDYNGQIAAVRIDDEATLKKVYKYDSKVVLQPANAAYEPLVYVKDEINNLTIEGVATGFTHKFALRNKK